MLVTPINVQKFTHWIKGFEFQDYLIQGLTDGFRIGYEGPRFSRECENLKSCRDLPHIVTEKIDMELALGRIQGPFDDPPFQNLQVSPIGLVPKKKQGEYRIIHHLSYPEGGSINDFIGDELSTVTYCKFDDAVALVLELGQGCLLSKCDLESAYRILPISSLDYELIGFKWQSKYYYDTCLTMGLSSSAAIFTRFSSGLKWIAQTKLGISFILHILDDFLILGPSGTNSCMEHLQKFLSLCQELGVPIKGEKTKGPCTCLTFMGLEIDSVRMEARLPQDKLERVRFLLRKYQKCRKIKLQELQSIIGLLSFCCSVVRPGRCFLRRLIDLTVGVSRPNHRVTLNKAARRDLSAWLIFVEFFNGSNLLLQERWITSPALDLHTDASGSLGYGAIFKEHWIMGAWPEHLIDFPITFKEIFPVVLALEIWGNELRNQCIILHIDNMAAVYILNKQSSRDKDIMVLVRRFVLACMKYNILTKCIHVPTHQNILPDSVSRFQIEKFRLMAPHMDREPTAVPAELLTVEQ